MFRTADQGHEIDTGHTADPLAGWAQEHWPLPALRLFSSSPPLLQVQLGVLRHYSEHSRLGLELLAAIRLMAASALSAPECLVHSRGLLASCGFTDADINALPEANEVFFDAEIALLRFVHEALSDPGAARDQDLHTLRSLGWDDATVLDALAHGASVQVPDLLLKIMGRKAAERGGAPPQKRLGPCQGA